MRAGLPRLHIYYEPFVRSDFTLRLLASPAIENYSGNRPGSMSAVNIRYKELWGNQGSQNDRLLVNGAQHLHAGALSRSASRSTPSSRSTAIATGRPT